METSDVNRLYRVSWCDPAGGPDTRRSNAGLSRSAIVTIGLDQLERIFILEAWAARIAPDQLIERVFENNAKWRPAAFGIDASGPQLMFAQLLQKEARERGVRLPLRPTALRAEKSFSIETSIQPICSSGRLFRPPENECRGLMDEWKSFPDGTYRDTLDALACAIRLLPSMLPQHLREMGREQLRRYLERSGMHNDEVEMRLRQHEEAARR